MNSKPHYTTLGEQPNDQANILLLITLTNRILLESWWKLDEHISKQKCDLL